MITPEEFKAWRLRLNLSNEAMALINQVRTSEPIRAARSGGNNVIGLYPSRKMGRTLQFESHRCELPFIQKIERCDEALEIWDQPAKIPISYETKAGRKVNVSYTPDFLVLWKDRAEFIECKTEEELIKLSEETPSRYRRDEFGGWHSPAAQESLKDLGISHRVVSAASINPVYTRNLEFLDDYLRDDSLSVSEQARRHILSLAGGSQGIKLSDLIHSSQTATEQMNVDDIYALIVLGEIYVDLYAVPLVDYEKVLVFPDRESAISFTDRASTVLVQTGAYLELTVGARITWDNSPWEITNIGAENVWLAGERGHCYLPHALFEDYLLRGCILTKRRSGQSLIDHADTIRMIASLSGTIHVLLGTYDLLALRNLNGQLGRRSHTVHFGRYGSNSEDVESFTRAFLSFQAHLPVAVVPNLIRDLEFCYLRCLGCIGLLKNWFMRSLVIAIEDQRETVDLKLFRSQATPNSVCLEIAQEIRDGESRLEEKDDELAHAILRELLGSKMSPGHVTRPMATKGNDLNVQTGPTQPTSTSASGGKRGRVGRNPKRYPVGKTTDES